MLDRLVDWNGHKLPTRIVNVFDNYDVKTPEDARLLLLRFEIGERIINFGEKCAATLRRAPFIEHY